MLAYKGMHEDMTCTKGKGRFQYRLGETIKENYSKTASGGLHCAENPLDCLKWYSMDHKNRFFLVEAAGSIDEDGTDSKIACTEMTLLKELTVAEFAQHTISYIVSHPEREWQHSELHVKVLPDKAEAGGNRSIAIARGENPKVRGKRGDVLGLIKQKADGVITEVGLCIVGAQYHRSGKMILPNTWYRLEKGRLEVRIDEA